MCLARDRRGWGFAGDIGLEIAPEIDANPALDKIGSVWNTVPTAKEWAAIDPIEGAITVNVGDALSWWTDGERHMLLCVLDQHSL